MPKASEKDQGTGKPEEGGAARALAGSPASRTSPAPRVSWSGSRGTPCDVIAARVWMPGASLYKGPNNGVGASSPSPLLTAPPVLQTGDSKLQPGPGKAGRSCMTRSGFCAEAGLSAQESWCASAFANQ